MEVWLAYRPHNILQTLHTPIARAPLLSLSPPSSSTPLYESTSPLLMPPTTFPIPISTIVSVLPPSDTSTSCSNSMPIALQSNNLHLHISLCKGKHSCTLQPISHFCSNHNFHHTYRVFSLSLIIESIPKSYLEAVKLPQWKASMDSVWGSGQVANMSISASTNQH